MPLSLVLEEAEFGQTSLSEICNEQLATRVHKGREADKCWRGARAISAVRARGRQQREREADKYRLSDTRTYQVVRVDSALTCGSLLQATQ